MLICLVVGIRSSFDRSAGPPSIFVYLPKVKGLSLIQNILGLQALFINNHQT